MEETYSPGAVRAMTGDASVDLRAVHVQGDTAAAASTIARRAQRCCRKIANAATATQANRPSSKKSTL